MKWTDFLHVGANSRKLKVILLIFEWEWSKMLCLKNEWIELIFLHDDYDTMVFCYINIVQSKLYNVTTLGTTQKWNLGQVVVL